MNFSVASFFENSNSWSYKSGVEDKNKKENESYIYKMSNHCCYLKGFFFVSLQNRIAKNWHILHKAM